MSESGAPRAGNSGRGSGFEWVSSSPTAAEISVLESRFPEVIRVSEEALEESSACWKKTAVIARTFQRWIPSEAFVREFRRAGISGPIHPVSLAHRCHIFRFEDEESKDLVLRRPWVINGQPAAMEAWHQDFIPAADAVASVVLWMRLPYLPIEYWTEALLKDIVKPAGDFLFIDPATRLLSRGGFARVCLRIDLRQPLRPGVRLQGSTEPFWQQFQYEYLEGICPDCGSIHLSGLCNPSSPMQADARPSRCFGSWMSASRRRRTQEPERRKASTVVGQSPAAPGSLSLVPVKPLAGSEVWQLPSKSVRRKAARVSGSAVGVVTNPVSKVSVEMKGKAVESGNCSVNEGVPVCCNEEAVPVSGGKELVLLQGSGVAVKSQLQSVNSELQVSVNQNERSNNPFALLGVVTSDGSTLVRPDSNPGPSKRARPEEPRSARKSVHQKHKGVSLLGKGRKGKGPDESGSEGSLSLVTPESKVQIRPSLEVANQGQSFVFGIPAECTRADKESMADADTQSDRLLLDCAMQSEVGDIQLLKQGSDLMMVENQGGTPSSS